MEPRGSIYKEKRRGPSIDPWGIPHVMEAKEDVSILEEKLMEAEQRAKDAEDNMRQAAMYGKVLLEKNMELETQFEGLQQEKYETNMRLQVIKRK